VKIKVKLSFGREVDFLNQIEQIASSVNIERGQCQMKEEGQMKGRKRLSK